MPTFTFDGFAVGSSVAMSVSQNALTANETVSSWGSSVASLNILINTAPIVTAPAPIWAEAIELSGFAVSGGAGPGDVVDPSFGGLTYNWTVRKSDGAGGWIETPLPDYTAPSRMVAGWNDANTAHGKKIAFCLTDPGTYEIGLWAVDRTGVWAEATAYVAVADPASAYPTTRTVIFDPTGNFTGAPAGTQVSSLAALQSVLDGTSAPMRVRVRRGTVTPDFILRLDSTHGMGHMDTWGSGDAPVLQVTGQSLALTIKDTNETQITISGIAFEGPWDPTTETGFDPGFIRIRDRDVTCTYLFHDCAISGFKNIDINSGVNVPDNRIMFADCAITDWRNFGFFLDKSHEGYFALIGSRIAQNPDALNGGGKNGLHNDHGPIRITDTGTVYIAVCDFYTNAGWSRSVHDTQPCIRVNSSGEGGKTYVLDRNVLEGGFAPVEAQSYNFEQIDYPGNYLVDRMLVIGTSRTTAALLSWDFGGTTIRNVIGIMPDIVPFESRPDAMFRFNADSEVASEAANQEASIEIYNCTGLSLVSAANDNGYPMDLFKNLDYFTGSDAFNNIIHTPFGTTSLTASAPVNLSVAMPGLGDLPLAPRHKGLRFNFEPLSGTFSLDVPNGTSVTVPYSVITRMDTIGNGSATPTDQAYWLANMAAGDTFHRISIGNGSAIYYAAAGEIAVSFDDPTVIVITNLSGSTWDAGAQFALQLDRKSRLDTELPLDTFYGSPATVPLPRPVNDPGGLGVSPAINAGNGGLTAHDDFLRQPRLEGQAEQGALQEA